jgi:hypothetical protein
MKYPSASTYWLLIAAIMLVSLAAFIKRAPHRSISIGSFSTTRKSVFTPSEAYEYVPPTYTHQSLPEETLFILDGTAMLFKSYFSRENKGDYSDALMEPELVAKIISDLALTEEEISQLKVCDVTKSERRRCDGVAMALRRRCEGVAMVLRAMVMRVRCECVATALRLCSDRDGSVLRLCCDCIIAMRVRCECVAIAMRSRYDCVGVAMA